MIAEEDVRGHQGYVVLARKVSNILLELRNIGQVLLLMSRPGSREPVQGVTEGHVVCLTKQLPTAQRSENQFITDFLHGLTPAALGPGMAT